MTAGICLHGPGVTMVRGCPPSSIPRRDLAPAPIARGPDGRRVVHRRQCRRGHVATEANARNRRAAQGARPADRSEEHTSELQSLMRTSYAVFGLKKKILLLKL